MSISDNMPQEIKHFAYLITPVKPNFNETMTDEDRKIMSEHFLYFKDLFEKDKIVLIGPCLDASMGIGIFKVSTYEEAKQIADNDPAVLKGVVTAQVKEIRISLFNPNPK